MQFYTRLQLLAVIQGTDGTGSRFKNPSRVHPAPTPGPVPAPADVDSFRRMFEAWILDHYRLRSCRALPGGNVTVLTAGKLSSQQIATYENGATGILKTDCLGQRHFFSSDSIQGPALLYQNTSMSEDIKVWLVKDYHAREDELKKWWEAAENSQSAVEIQIHLLLSFRDLWDRINQHAAAAVTSWQILEKPLEIFNTTLNRLYWDWTNTTSSGSPPIQETGPGQRKHLLKEEFQFRDLVAMAWGCRGLKILWGPGMSFLPFEYNAKVVRIIPSHIDPTDLALERKRVVIPRWKVETIHVPLDCDWERLIKHLDALFPVDNDLCRSCENQAQDCLLENAVKVPKAQLSPLLPKLKALQKRAFRNIPGWNYSILTSSDDDDEIFCGKYVRCKDNADYAKMMAVVMAHRQIVLARGTTISCLRLTTRMADVNDSILEISNEGADGS